MKDHPAPTKPGFFLLQQEKGHIRQLDGLRGIAILMVVLFHNFDYLSAFSLGWIGVDIFFVLSGFLITTIFLKDLDTPYPIFHFYVKRVLRIFPLYYLSLILLLLVLPLFIHDPVYKLLPGHRPWFWFCLQNWLYILKKIPPSEAPHLRHFWSLALEEQFYLLWPWILFLVKKTRYTIHIICCLLAILFIARIIIWSSGDKYLTYYFFICARTEGLCIGSLLAVALFLDLPAISRRLIIAFGCTLSACIAILLLRRSGIIDLPFYGMGGYLLISLSIAILIHHIIVKGHARALSNALLVQAGRISFGWYIFHWPVYLLLNRPIGNFLSTHVGHITVGKDTTPQMPYRIASSIICILLSGLLAYGSYYNYEIYFLKWKKRLSFSWKGHRQNVRPPLNK